MKYINTKTGVIIDSPCVINGGDWIEYKKEVVEEAEARVEELTEKVEEVMQDKVEEEPKDENEDLDESFDGITKKQITQELDAFGIEYNPRAKKQELYDLMMQGR